MVSRRLALKGLGVSMALPWLVSAQGKRAQKPVRTAYVFMPNGFIMPSWNVTGTGKNYKLSETLQILKAFKDDFNVYSNLCHYKAKANGDGPGDHARCSGTFLTAVQLKKTSGNIRAGISIDQVAASKIGHLTELPSLEVGCERGQLAGSCDSGYSCAYSGNISWKNEKLPMVKEINPRLVFTRLFGDPKQHSSRQEKAQRAFEDASILDLVRSESKDLMKGLGRDDKAKMDEYLEAVRAVEKRLQVVEKERVAFKVPKMPHNVPREYKEHLRLMYELMVLAFQADKTRIATMALGNGGSNRRYGFLGLNEGHHSISHHGNDPKKVGMIKKIDRFQIEQFSYFLRRLKETPDGDSNLLHNSLILLGSGISDGNRHSHTELPILLAGNGGGKIKTGEHRIAPKGTPLSNFFLSMLDVTGVHEKKFGDSVGRFI
jgi:hypothetical protein